MTRYDQCLSQSTPPKSDTCLHTCEKFTLKKIKNEDVALMTHFVYIFR